jgi:hypothetical protein
MVEGSLKIVQVTLDTRKENGSLLQAPGSRLQAPGSRLQAPGSRLQAPGSRLKYSFALDAGAFCAAFFKLTPNFHKKYMFLVLDGGFTSALFPA